MNILYDLISTQPVGKTLYHGGGAYCERVFCEIVNKNKKCKIKAVADKQRVLSKKILDFCKEKSIEILFIESKKDLEKVFLDEKINTFFYSDYNEVFRCNIPKDIKVIYVCHDLRMLDLCYDNTLKYYCDSDVRSLIKNQFKIVFKNFYTYYLDVNVKKRIWELLERADVVLTPSMFSKYSILSHFPKIDLKKIRVCYAPDKLSIEGAREKGEKSNFFLLVSTNRYEKNAYRALKAFDNIFSEYDLNEYTVVCTGMPSKKIRNELKNKHKFNFKGYVEEQELQRLYRNAYAFVFPSINEGFGYPPIEAMKYGTLVLSSAITSMPELCGDAVLYFEPFSIKEIENRILYAIFEDTSLLKNKAISQYQMIREKQEDSLKEIVQLILSEI